MQEVMVRAHEIARTLEGDYSARMALALRQAWFEQRLIAAGGRLWEKHGLRRIYFNRLTEWYGLEYDTYKSGNVRDAWVDGQRISNSQARGMIWRLEVAKLWYDLADGRFHARGVDRNEDFERIVERIKEAA